MTDVGLTGADPLDITQSGQEPTFDRNTHTVCCYRLCTGVMAHAASVENAVASPGLPSCGGRERPPECTMSLWRRGGRSAPPLDFHGTRPPAAIMQGCLIPAPSRAFSPGHAIRWRTRAASRGLQPWGRTGIPRCCAYCARICVEGRAQSRGPSKRQTGTGITLSRAKASCKRRSSAVHGKSGTKCDARHRRRHRTAPHGPPCTPRAPRDALPPGRERVGRTDRFPGASPARGTPTALNRSQTCSRGHRES
jgi:hypothetical protein